jgi:hypothetical protein
MSANVVHTEENRYSTNSIPGRCFPDFLRLELCPEGSLLDPNDKAPQVAHHPIVVFEEKLTRKRKLVESL